jgi:hypothetical protein
MFQHTVAASDHLVESLDAFAERSLIGIFCRLSNLFEHLAFFSGEVAAQGLRIPRMDRLVRGALCSQSFLIIVMFLLRADASSNRKSVYYITGNGRKGAGLENREVLYAFSSNRIGPDRGRSSPRADQSLHTDGRIY